MIAAKLSRVHMHCCATCIGDLKQKGCRELKVRKEHFHVDRANL